MTNIIITTDSTARSVEGRDPGSCCQSRRTAFFNPLTAHLAIGPQSRRPESQPVFVVSLRAA